MSGKKKFEVVSINGTEIKCKVIVGGDTKGRRSLNLPGAPLKISALTDKDKKDYTGRKIEVVATYILKTKSQTFWPPEEVEKYGLQIIQFETK